MTSGGGGITRDPHYLISALTCAKFAVTLLTLNYGYHVDKLSQLVDFRGGAPKLKP